ncbi:class I SAM-dependent methyltransferase [Paenibacillus sp. FSL R10-2736]|uniref:class I SAM-dependent methyltransferase n=1 Tax=Paenibacillus sp. FSL R10-2736 TaxID=2954692 RepID=UPI0030F73D66
MLEILDTEQNDVLFTGERVVINDVVKKNYGDVLEEHLNRYRLAQKYVKDKRVLDAACGAGYGSKMLQAAGASHVLGVDIDEASLSNARKTYGHDQIDYAYGNVNKLELEDKSFDVVVSFETIEHIDDGSVWIKESSRLLKDDGIFIVSTPNRSIANPSAYFVEQPRNHYHKYEYTIVELVGELLKEYDILELYGQTFTTDYVAFQTQIIRKARNLGAASTPYTNPVISGYELVALGEVKDMNPLYVVAVCRKKCVAPMDK